MRALLKSTDKVHPIEYVYAGANLGWIALYAAGAIWIGLGIRKMNRDAKANPERTAKIEDAVQSMM